MRVAHFGSHTFVPIGWICKKQTAVSHSSTEADTIAVDAGLRLEGLPLLSMWDTVTDELEPPVGSSALHNKPKKTESLMAAKRMTDIIYFVSPKARISSQRASLFVSEDNDAVIKMTTKRPEPDHMASLPDVVSHFLYSVRHRCPKCFRSS